MKKIAVIVSLCLCVWMLADEYGQQRVEFIKKNFDSRLKLWVEAQKYKSETTKLLVQAAVIPLIYRSGLKGNDSNGGWEEFNSREFWDKYYEVRKRVKEACGTDIVEKKTEKVTRDRFGNVYTINESYDTIKENYTPAQQKCVKPLATLELEVNKEIIKWKLEFALKGEDKTLLYQAADAIWEKFKKEAKLVMKDFNKPGMEQFVKGMFYWWWIDDKNVFSWTDRIDGFFYFYERMVGEVFSFLYESVEENNKKLEEVLIGETGQLRDGDRIYLSLKEYQEELKEQEKVRRVKFLRYSMFSHIGSFLNGSRLKENDFKFEECMGWSESEGFKEDSEDGGQYAELVDEKYYIKDANNGLEIKEDIKDNALYKQLAWCAVKECISKQT